LIALINLFIESDLLANTHLWPTIRPGCLLAATARDTPRITAELTTMAVRAGMLGGLTRTCVDWLIDLFQAGHRNESPIFDTHLPFHNSPNKTQFVDWSQSKTNEKGKQKSVTADPIRQNDRIFLHDQPNRSSKNALFSQCPL
jgi:hypothetical protein